MPTGKIKWFNQQIGAGFIRSDEGENVFFRLSAINSDDSKTIQRGQCVRFDIATESPEHLPDSGQRETLRILAMTGLFSIHQDLFTNNPFHKPQAVL